jgi:uncharacterized protein (DUF1501 family)
VPISIGNQPVSRAASARLSAWMPRLAFTPRQRDLPGDILVIIFLRGAADALNMIVPHGDPAYYALRPTLGIPRPDDRRAPAGERALDLDGFFGLHPALTPLLSTWQAGHLAVVHACGAPDESRSHFLAMELMERGVENQSGPASGWIGRHLATLDEAQGPPEPATPLRVIGMGVRPQRSLSGPVPVTALRSIADFHLQGNPRMLAQFQSALEGLYSTPGEISTTGKEALQLLTTLQALNPLAYKPAGDHSYPESEFGMSLKQVAMLIKAEVGLEVAAVDLGGWDTHFAQGGSQGLMASLLGELGQGLAAFYADLADLAERMSIVVQSEFGRRAHENGSLGTDHGHAGAMLLLGGHLVGGKVHGAWPGLEDGLLVGPGDLAVTTDYRDVLGELCLKRLHNPALGSIFPGYTPKQRGVFL